MEPSSTTTRVITYMHPVYRIWFTWADATITWATVAAAFVAPGAIYEALVPASVGGARNAGHDALVNQMGALYISIALTATVLLRVTRDATVWRVVQGSVLAVDLALIAIMIESLSTRGMLHPAAWAASDWQNMGLTVWVAVLRGFFIAEVGVKTQTVKFKVA
ncbi:hypothetical protein Micbo1qcDRAFT_230244 [Microdochium bolleyi]|uniref:DUF7704 domain-containing protein n=1 Tax=Microdochium bolleyi TaxID=196109 RepID=A0A136JKG4_9PEZI|nr:hypothetical protein Micbo1qcDRAFT_230244 [Microdochium bolleyi]